MLFGSIDVPLPDEFVPLGCCGRVAQEKTDEHSVSIFTAKAPDKPVLHSTRSCAAQSGRQVDLSSCIAMPVLHQAAIAQPSAGTAGHATRAGHTESQPEPWHYDLSADGSGFPKPPAFDDKFQEREYLKGRLAAAFRIFGQSGFDEGVAGHITVRDPVEPHTMWVNPFGTAFSHIRRSDLIRIDYDGKVLGGGSARLVNRAAVLIHAAVHRARPDVMCAAHTHSLHGRAFATLGIPLPITSQDGCAFYNDLAFYNAFEGIVLEGAEGEHIAQAIGNKKAAILQNHGLITCGATVEATVFWYVSLEKLCGTHLAARAACGGREEEIVKVGDQEAAK
nr:meiotically up-regulated gene 14 protein [Quercus suber]